VRLILHEARFFELFDELSGYLIEGAKLLRGILEDPKDLRMRVEQVQAVEHKGDRLPTQLLPSSTRALLLPSTVKTFTGSFRH
jgi:uncharacterized protein Yka (UPF0111/DUF47 family)